MHYSERDQDRRNTGPAFGDASADVQRCARGHPHLPQRLPQPHHLRRIQAALLHPGAQRSAQGIRRRHKGNWRHLEGHCSQRGSLQTRLNESKIHSRKCGAKKSDRFDVNVLLFASL